MPLNVQVLQALNEEPQSLFDLRRAVGNPPSTTMRGHLKVLTDAGIVTRHQQREFPGCVDFSLDRAGRELVQVLEAVERWLSAAPSGPVELGTPAAKSTIKALVEGWSSAVIRALAARPLTLTELSRLITGLSYPSLERRLTALRLAGQIERCSGAGRGTPYAVTDWLRRSMGPILVGLQWERRFAPADSAPLRRIDIEAIFLLASPMLDLSDDRRGTCRFAVELGGSNGNPRVAGALLGIDEGKVTSCVCRLEGEAEAWVSGSASSWLEALIDHESEGLEIGGDLNLARTLLDEMHTSLFGVRQGAAAST
jgi:DNA-binding HxlR family transcriptional regulator